METLLVRLKPYDPRRGYLLRRYTYQGIKFHVERGWYRVDKEVADYLRDIRQVFGDSHSPLAFDVYTEAESKALDEEEAQSTTRKQATNPIEAHTEHVKTATEPGAKENPKSSSRSSQSRQK